MIHRHGGDVVAQTFGILLPLFSRFLHCEQTDGGQSRVLACPAVSSTGAHFLVRLP